MANDPVAVRWVSHEALYTALIFNLYWRSDWSNSLCQTYARLSCSKQLLNDVIFIWFTDKSTPKNSHSLTTDCVHPLQKRRKTLQQNAFFAQEYVQSVAASVSKLDCTGLIIIDPWVKINEICYCVLLLRQWVLPGIMLGHSLVSSETVLQCTVSH